MINHLGCILIYPFLKRALSPLEKEEDCFISGGGAGDVGDDDDGKGASDRMTEEGDIRVVGTKGGAPDWLAGFKLDNMMASLIYCPFTTIRASSYVYYKV